MKKKIVVLSGAGISAESGISTFRDSNGLWNNHRIEDVATPEAFQRNPALVLEFYNARRKNILQAEPNDAHKILAELESDFDVTIVTQNIDDLHERGGSSNVVHLHGEITKTCNESKTMTYPYDRDLVPGDLATDGSFLRPFIVWFGEEVPELYRAGEIVAQADILIIIGTSLQVYPAAGLIHDAAYDAEIYLIDTDAYNIHTSRQITRIAEPATIGMKILKEQLLQSIK